MRFASTTLMILMTLVASFGCGDTETKSNNVSANNVSTNNATTNNSTTNNTTANNSSSFTFCEEDDGSAWDESYSMRVDAMTFTEGAGKGLNGLITNGLVQDTQDYPIVVLLDIRDLDQDAGTFQLRGGSGLKTDTAEEYEWDPDAVETYEPGTFDPDCGAINVTVTLFEFVATFELESGPEKVVLPINELKFDAAIAREGGSPSINEGTLEGYITKEDADTIEITLIPGGSPIILTSVLKESLLDYDTATGMAVEPGTGDAWLMKATFTAIDTTIIE